ncbi:MAG TPA: J domain-containing protein [Firmicutes bacterium]|nr:J domain-containing protein [Bacillota bacterium]
MKAFRYINDDIESANVYLDLDIKLRFIRNLIRLANTFQEERAEMIKNIRNISVELGIPDTDFSEILFSFEYKSSSEIEFGDEEKEFSKALAILDVSEDLSFDEIKTRYRNLVRKYHPDKMVNSSIIDQERAQKKMRELNWAYTRIKKEFNKE